MNETTETDAGREDPGLEIAGRRYRSRLLTGTGKYRDLEQTRAATEAAGAEIVTVAIRRSNVGQKPDEPNLLDVLPPDRGMGVRTMHYRARIVGGSLEIFNAPEGGAVINCTVPVREADRPK